MARLTRREEESGRLDLLARAGRPGSPVAVAMLVALGTVAVTAGVFAICLVLIDIPTGPAVLYASSLAGLALCFAAVATLAAQGVRRSRGVYAVGLAVLAAAYIVRGVGDVKHSWVTWLSPLGWSEQTRAFGADRWAPLALPLVFAALAFGAALVVSARRDVGSAWVSSGRGPTGASATLLHTGGLGTAERTVVDARLRPSPQA